MVMMIFKLAAVPVGLALTSYGIYAFTDRRPKGSLLHYNQLSIYSIPPHQSKYIAESPGHIQSGFSVHLCSSIKNGVHGTIQFGKDSYIYLKNPPQEFLPKIAVITVSGLAGLVLARNGSRLKKIAYPLGLTTLGISACYPTQAVIFAKVTGRKMYTVSHRTYDAVNSSWKTSSHRDHQKETEDLKQVDKVPVTEGGHDHGDSLEKIVIQEHTKTSDIESPEPIISLKCESAPLVKEVPDTPAFSDSATQPRFKPDPSLLDHGQSNPEDADLYSTRS
ncbi:hypothetical protein GDO86_015475 [Hymenochirus boettgeri]|uniref:MICOS complex subunit n=1 Tax=Hymenochirus boettgeri TaxID=247094 RepID=A0A8T2JY12_9PIPI|nr:hypothetical protein GDO86_015475 [Hymenochirus boettgeri]